ncbi:TetR family transcriptional regulator [Photobacterium swingsii]|uniref:TetR/AcrR family transcriptional regulator n=1 Tax=Photobacterium swingsii TaxID=680026 RepID=A0A0J8VE30_9GAMM|nr:TetR/AcrR family transcriptional regulator [Photobacterium swingsii]KMV30770.1 TetR family transcriptional regulator [Photobacterium swingsii]PSW25922.1 TetR/AcrR family transcriptional regulator [Photobacterium swingsii]
MSRKQRVIEAATELFASQGFEKTPVSLICEVAEVSKGTVFHHFKNKDEILRAVFLYITEFIEEADKQDQHIEDDVLSSLIKSVFDGMTIPEHRLMYQFNFNVMVHPVTRAIVADLIEERYQGLQASTEEVFRRLGHDNPTIITKMFIAEIDGIAMNYLLNDDFPIEAIQIEFTKKYCQ